jgi:hypothetical protein
MSNARPAFVEHDTIATKPVQLYGFSNGAPVRLSADADGKLSMEGLGIPTHDEIDVAYSGGNPVTVAFKLASATVATLTLTYTGGVPTNIVKS